MGLFRQTKNDSGFSLVEMLVVVAIMGIVALASAQMLAQQSKNLKAIDQKLFLNDVKTQLQTFIGKSDMCRCLLKTNTFKTTGTPKFNGSISSVPSTYNFPLPTGGAACNSSGVPRLIPAIGNEIPGSRIKVETIEAKNFTDLGGGIYSGTLEIGLQQDTLVRALKPITVPIVVNVDLSSGTPAARPLSACSNEVLVNKVKAYYSAPRHTIGAPADIFPSGSMPASFPCLTSRVAIQYGGSFDNLNTTTGVEYEDSRGDLNLYVNGARVSRRLAGGRVGSGGDLTDAPATVHGMWVGNCPGSIAVRLRFESESATLPPPPPSNFPQILQNYVRIEFLDP